MPRWKLPLYFSMFQFEASNYINLLTWSLLILLSRKFGFVLREMSELFNLVSQLSVVHLNHNWHETWIIFFLLYHLFHEWIRKAVRDESWKSFNFSIIIYRNIGKHQCLCKGLTWISTKWVKSRLGYWKIRLVRVYSKKDTIIAFPFNFRTLSVFLWITY